eukprot:TRINITY_DN115793_c0_g1_i1.p1 TRINITY_DN115793_c0_g1~~TRINITY_DN115793_c0_g1_i1.p1  ORF type:complete len:384 (-),score=93.52 TRINITY_DN115793_c0_g1_i1:9-1160(-)
MAASRQHGESFSQRRSFQKPLRRYANQGTWRATVIVALCVMAAGLAWRSTLGSRTFVASRVKSSRAAVRRRLPQLLGDRFIKACPLRRAASRIAARAAGDAEASNWVWGEQLADLMPQDLCGRPGTLNCPEAEAMSEWVKRVVIGHNLCPWASASLRSGGLAMVALSAGLEEEEDVAEDGEEVDKSTALCASLMEHAQLLAQAKPPPGSGGASTVAVAPFCAEFLDDFEVFCDVCTWVDAALDEMGLAGKVQLARFHPDFFFADSDPADASNYVGRAPCPAFHLLREEEVSAALEEHAARAAEAEASGRLDTEAAGMAVADRNSAFLRERGVNACIHDLEEVVAAARKACPYESSIGDAVDARQDDESTAPEAVSSADAVSVH